MNTRERIFRKTINYIMKNLLKKKIMQVSILNKLVINIKIIKTKN